MCQERSQHVVHRGSSRQLACQVGQSLTVAGFVGGPFAQQRGLKTGCEAGGQHAHGFVLDAVEVGAIQAWGRARVQAAIDGMVSPPAATDTSAASMAGSPRACRNAQPEAKTATPAPATLSRATSRRMSASSAKIWWRRIE